ncbi:MAG: hypothetical protein GY937_26350 [bacterium]|nr:hypothetical protein [bacterium]
MVVRRIVLLGLGISFGLVVSTGAWAQAVLQSVTVRVNPGQMSTYLERVAALQGTMDRVGSGGKVQVWNATVAGTATGNTLVTVGHSSLAAYAETTTKMAADPEWQKIFAGLDDIRTVVSNGLIVSQDGGGLPAAAESGAVLQGVLVRVKPGQLATYLERVAALKQVQKRVGSSGSMRVWQATLAGEATGTVAVGIVHPNLVAYAENTAKLQADAEGQKLLAGLDAIRTVVSTSLFVSP